MQSKTAAHEEAVAATLQRHAQALKAAVEAQSADGAEALEGAVQAKEEHSFEVKR